MPIFDKRPNSKRSPAIRKMKKEKEKRNVNRKSELLNPMSQHGRNNIQQVHWKNKR